MLFDFVITNYVASFSPLASITNYELLLAFAYKYFTNLTQMRGIQWQTLKLSNEKTCV